MLKIAKVDSKQANLDRLVAKEEAEKALELAEKKAKQLAEEEAKRTFFYQAGNKILDGKGNVVPGYTTNGTQVFNAHGEFAGYLTTDVKSRRVSQEIKKQMAAQLPQTGEKTEQTFGKLAALMVGIASA